ncbi:hypothetical protein ROA7450_00696 [Roseovarius albus]|uniref:Uncharacterized protein n=1 Tax=Roseovarius albus TaxID=1247867 RepID=A0A1X6YGW1_9RHOB|nr:hypothetical protein [Roseovarius albus]SLN20496.1 hypothetical protein ROA7450_00696 [Roseovarius albus]
MKAKLIIAGATWFCATTTSAEMITERMEWQQIVSAAHAECALEWQAVANNPLPENQYDILRWELEHASDASIGWDTSKPWPRSPKHYRDIAFATVMAADAALVLSLQALSVEYGKTQKVSEYTFQFVRAYQARRAFQECLKLTPNEYIELREDEDGPHIDTRRCMAEVNAGIDTVLKRTATFGVPVSQNEFKRQVLDVMLNCDLPN